MVTADDAQPARGIRIREFGGPEVLLWEPLVLPDPGPGEVRIRHTAVGLNMIDTYFRSGLYPIDLPSGLGSEGAGVVTALGADVTDLAVGDRVAYAAPPPLCGYATARNIARQWLVPVPADISDATAAAMMLKGLTAWYLLRRSYRVRAGDWVLLHAAAGGVGSIVARWATALGARVIGVIGSEAKRRQAEQAGCAHVLCQPPELAKVVRELTNGAGVAAAYDSVGRDTFAQSLASLRPHGVLVSFGNSSGPVEPVSPLDLMRGGSLYLTRPTLFDFIRDPGELAAAAAELFTAMAADDVRILVNQTYPLDQAAQAHRDLEARRTTGCTVLLP